MVISIAASEEWSWNALWTSRTPNDVSLSESFCHLSVMLRQDVVVLDAGSGFLKAQNGWVFLKSRICDREIELEIENDH